jgi:RNA polymerase sigma-70 factor (ECF subfamily)
VSSVADDGLVSTGGLATAAARGSGDADLARLEPMLRGFARRALGGNDVVDDLVQDALLAATEQRASFRGSSRLGTWVVGILAHKIVDHFRRSSRWRTEAIDEADPPGLLDAAPRRDPERELELREAVRIVEAALPALPELERMAVLLVDVQSADRAEACHALGVNATHLRVLLHRGRHKLRKVLEDADVQGRA